MFNVKCQNINNIFDKLKFYNFDKSVILKLSIEIKLKWTVNQIKIFLGLNVN